MLVTRAKYKPADNLERGCWVLEHSFLLFLLFGGLLFEVLAG